MYVDELWHVKFAKEDAKKEGKTEVVISMLDLELADKKLSDKQLLDIILERSK